MPTQEQFEVGLDFLTNLREKQKQENNKLLPFTEWVINQTVMAMNQMDLFK